MRTNSELKNAAIASLTGKWGEAAILVFIYFLVVIGISGALGMNEKTSYASPLLNFLIYPMVWGLSVAFLEVSRGMKVEYGRLIDGYKDFARIALTGLLKYVYIFLWTLLLIIPGIVKCYSYSMTEFILRDDPEISYNAAIEKSMRMMRGNKMKLFLLDLSFIGWAILCIFTLGIGFLFLSPYKETAHAHFYDDIKDDCVETFC